MIRINVGMGRARPETGDSPGAGEGSPASRMRSEAVNLYAEGRGKLALPRSVIREMNAIAAQAQRFRGDDTDAMKVLLRDMKQMMICMQRARAESVCDLPKTENGTRIECVLRLLCGGEVRLTEDRLLLGVASFDDVQPLEMAELWAVPEAIRICISRAYVRAARSVIELAEARSRAQACPETVGDVPARRGAAFFGHARGLISRSGETFCRPALNPTGTQADSAAVLMRLENLTAAARLIDSLNWQRCFAELSCVENELQCDPSGVYPKMEEDSKDAVRRELAMLARRMHLSELTLARHAVRLARLSAEDEPARQTVCFWLYDDAGRAQLARRVGAQGAILPKLVPDASGRRSVAALLGLFGLCFCAYAAVVRNVPLAVLTIPPAWGMATAVLDRFFPWFLRPAKLLKLKVDRVEDDQRTLVVMPVLLSSAARAEEICDRLEALGCMERDANIRYLLLGDFADADRAEMPGDEAIVETVRKRVETMNAWLGRKQFFYLHRNRSLLQADGKWMGRDRKRGALMDLNRLLLGESGAQKAFGAEGEACAAIAKRFRYVLTLDADTQFLPGAVQRLIGTIAHPMNRPRTERGARRGYAILQPQMEMTARACVNGFVRLLAGSGGVNGYPCSVSGFWQDATGTGLFGGKGIYDVQAFSQALEGALPEGRILSHDLIEGTLAGAAQVSDICFYDGFPASMAGFLKRQHRWIRGDWQLLPILLGAWKIPGRKLAAAEKLRMADNLMRSLCPPALLGLLIAAVWTGNGGALGLGMLTAFRAPVLHLFGGDRLQWRRAIAELAMLPAYAFCAADAIARTLWRLTVSGRHLLDWVTSADAEQSAEGSPLPNHLAAILMVPGLFIPGCLPAALALGLLFLTGPGWVRDMEQPDAEEELSPEDAETLRELACDTWRFFDRTVTDKSRFLPPDNLQEDPPAGAAMRTSPTNIGLYLMSCVAARRLERIDEGEMIRRMSAAADTIRQMEKWNGHLYNWYDLNTLEPLKPKFVSSVDSGNLAAALLLCASATESHAELSESLRTLAREMNLAALYDGKRRLFFIGTDAETGRMSDAHYDLLASESRILSYTAILLGQVPVRHWHSLGRGGVRTQAGAGLISWSGTMFEYLMPELFMHAPENTLLGQAVQTTVRLQQRYGTRMNRPWGVSESGCHAFDDRMQYRYRAFGLNELSLSGETVQDVVAPYASALAAMADPGAAAKNIRAMNDLGWRGGCGLYEAADYRQDAEGKPVKSYMAHHQGMTLCAICNVLTDGSLRKDFERIPEARAIALLLEEKMQEADSLYTTGRFTAGADSCYNAFKAREGRETHETGAAVRKQRGGQDDRRTGTGEADRAEAVSQPHDHRAGDRDFRHLQSYGCQSDARNRV